MFTFITRIEINPNVCEGKPVIKGTRLLVSDMLKRIKEGESWKDIFEKHPELCEEDLYAVVFYAGHPLVKERL